MKSLSQRVGMGGREESDLKGKENSCPLNMGGNLLLGTDFSKKNLCKLFLFCFLVHNWLDTSEMVSCAWRRPLSYTDLTLLGY